MDNKVKFRFSEFCEKSFSAFSCDANRLELPNDTRVSGTFKMFFSCLRSKRLIVYYCNNSKHSEKLLPLLLSDTEWELLQQYEAILQITNSFALSSQVDYPGYNCWAYYCMAYCKSTLSMCNVLSIIDLSVHNWNHKTKISKIPRRNLKKEDWSVHTIEFIDRLIAEYEKYFPGPDEDMIIMMHMHPYMVWGGFRYLKHIDPLHFNDDKFQEYLDVTMTFILNTYNKKFIGNKQRSSNSRGKSTDGYSNGTKSVAHIMSNMESLQKLIEESATTEIDRMMYLELFKEQEEELKNVTEKNYGKGHPENIVYDEEIKIDQQREEFNGKLRRQFSDYMKYCKEKMDVVSDLRNLYHNEFYMREEDQINWSSVSSSVGNAYQIFRYFDLLKWWKLYGSVHFPEIAIVASIMISKPTHNGFQERVFSRCTYIDNKLRQRKSEKNFEMQALNTLNAETVNQIGHVLNVELENDCSTYKKYIAELYQQENVGDEIITIDDLGDSNARSTDGNDDISIHTVSSVEDFDSSDVSTDESDDEQSENDTIDV